MHSASNQDIHLYLLQNSSAVYLAATTYVQCTGQITNGMWSGWTRLCIFIPDTCNPLMTPQEQLGSGLTAFAPVLGISAPACTNGVWPGTDLGSAGP